MIELSDVHKSFGATIAVDGVSLQIRAGSVAVLIGPSGSGKSTLLRLINRMIEADSGHITIEARDIRSLAPEALRRRIGYVIQSIGLFPHWTVARNIATVPRLLGWSTQRTASRVDELLTMLALAPAQFRDRYPHQLSGGQQQRVGVARALAAEPTVLLMDEPFGALDPVTRLVLQDELARIQQAIGCTIVLVTHDVDEALKLGQQLVLLEHGRIVQAGTPQQLLAEPVNAKVVAFFGGSSVGQRLLGLRRVAELLRAGEAAPGAPIRASQTLQQALSEFLTRGVDQLPVADDDGHPLGAIRFIDLLRQRP
ncbi:MAG: ABC transporter ATP-binding protein [Ideonella sp.]